MSSLLARLLLVAIFYALAILGGMVRAHSALAYWPHWVLLATCCIIVPRMLQAWSPVRRQERER